MKSFSVERQYVQTGGEKRPFGDYFFIVYDIIGVPSMMISLGISDEKHPVVREARKLAAELNKVGQTS